MGAFRIDIDPHRRAAARHVSNVRSALLRAFADQKSRGVTITSLAQTLGVHRAVLRRELDGRKDMSLCRVGELMYLLGVSEVPR